MRHKFPGQAAMGIILGIGCSIFMMIWSYFDPFQITATLEARFFEWRYRYRIARQAPAESRPALEDLLIIAMDTTTLQKLGPPAKWPMRYHAQVIETIDAGVPAAIGFQFPLNHHFTGDHPAQVDSFQQRLQKIPNLFLGFTFYPVATQNNPNINPAPRLNLADSSFGYQLVTSGIPNHLQSAPVTEIRLPEIYRAITGAGFVNYPNPRSFSAPYLHQLPLIVQYGPRQFPALALSMVMGTTGMTAKNLELHPDGRLGFRITRADSHITRLELPTDKTGQLYLNFQGPTGTFRHVSYIDVLHQQVSKALFRGKLVLVGSFNEQLEPWYPVPFQARMPEVEVQANLVHALINQDYLHQPGIFWLVIILTSFAIGVSLGSFRWRLHYRGLMVLLTLLGYLALCFLLFKHANLILPVLPVTNVILLSSMAATFLLHQAEIKDQNIFKNMFSRRISAKMVAELVKSRARFTDKGKHVQATVLFSDIKNFNLLTESLNPEELVSLLQEYHTVMAEIILKYDGYLDRYTGDTLRAVFGVPLPIMEHVQAACQAALEMQHRLTQLRVKWELEKKPGLESRIGLHTGALIVGNLGGDDRFEYTTLGESIQLAVRLQELNKIYGTSIIMSEDIYEVIKDTVGVRELDFILVRNRKSPLRIYELLAKKDDHGEENRQQALEYFAKGLALYRLGKWEQAYDQFQTALRSQPKDGPARKFLDRCMQFMDEKRFASPNWNGVYEPDSH
ncbi:CHASE2 domain-containing protein [candidate division KSB1 bacterium]|nr:CHASE2 domain-containing protein [candidate division KSB1 bacterium]